MAVRECLPISFSKNLDRKLCNGVSIVIGLTPAFLYRGIGGGGGREVGGIHYRRI